MSNWPFRIRFRIAMGRLVKKMGPGYIRAHSHSHKHREELLRSDRVGCFYCLETCSPGEIAEWIDNQSTAICMKCGIDSVIGSAAGFPLSRDFLSAMHQYWFERSVKI